MKTCTKCGETKDPELFAKDSTKRDGRSSHCKQCRKTIHADWRKKNPDKIRSSVLRKYGITNEDYEELLLWQGGRCGICLNKPRTKRLAVDHDHKTGAIRGLLCQRCNKNLLGGAHDSVQILKRAVAYMENPPAKDFFSGIQGREDNSS